MKKISVIIWLVFCLILGGCSSPTPEPAPPTPTPSPQDYLNISAAAFRNASSAQFELLRDGEPVIIAPDLGLVFTQAEGSYESPNKVFASVLVDWQGTILKVDMLWLPEGNFMTNPLTGRYGPMSPSIALTPSVLFESEGGIASILENGIQDAVEVGIEAIETGQARHIRGTASPETLSNVLLTDIQEVVQVDLWLHPQTSELLVVLLTESTGVTTLKFRSYNLVVEIPTP